MISANDDRGAYCLLKSLLSEFVDVEDAVDCAELLVRERVEPWLILLPLWPLLGPMNPNSAYMLYESRGDCCIAAKEKEVVGLVGKKPGFGEDG